jgi:DGQHR domain-containing protein
MVKEVDKIGPFDVIEVDQKGGTFFNASLPAKQLVEISYSDVRRLAKEERDIERYLGIQRPIDPKRVNEIRNYIDSPDPYFPTGVILAVDERCAEYDADNGHLTLFEYNPDDDEAESEYQAIPLSKVAKILDGQHRLAGFLDKDGNYRHEVDLDGPFMMNVSIFVGADLATQAQIFAKVNLAQTKVNRSLVYDLESLATTRSPFKTCHNIAVALDELENSPFRARIKRLGVITPGRTSETITQAAFVESLVRFISKRPFEDRNLLLDGRRLPPITEKEDQECPFRYLFVQERDFDIAENIVNYFNAIKHRWPRSWEDTSRNSGFLPKTNAFRAFMRFLRREYPSLRKIEGKDVISQDAYAQLFLNIDLQDVDLSTRVFVPGGSGEANFFKLLIGELSKDDLLERA